MAGQRRERGDAAANRERILCAARRVVAEQGVQGLTMQPSRARRASARGRCFVGSATATDSPRRCSTTTCATSGSLSAWTSSARTRRSPRRAPGGIHRRTARRQAENMALRSRRRLRPASAIAGLRSADDPHRSARAPTRPRVDERVLAGLILSAIAPPVLHRMRAHLNVDTPALQASARTLLRGVTHRPGVPGPPRVAAFERPVANHPAVADDGYEAFRIGASARHCSAGTSKASAPSAWIIT